MTRSLHWFRSTLPVLLLALAFLPGSAWTAEPATALISGRVVDANGKPAVGTIVEIQTYQLEEQVQTDSEGHFALTVEAQHLPSLMLVARTADSAQMAYFERPWFAKESELTQPVNMVLAPAKELIVHVNSIDGQPLNAARVGACNSRARSFLYGETDASGRVVLRIPADVEPSLVFAWKRGVGLDYHAFYALGESAHPSADLSRPIALTLGDSRTLKVQLVDDDDGTPLSGVDVCPSGLQKAGEPMYLSITPIMRELCTKTDSAGIAVFDWLPKWDQNETLRFWPISKNHAFLRASYAYATGGDSVTFRATKLVPISGHVRLPDGRPAVNVRVRATASGYLFNGYSGDTRTDTDGRYEFRATPDLLYMIVVDSEKWGAPPQTGFVLQRGEPVADLDFELRPATRIFGRVTIGPDQSPVADQEIQVYQYGADFRDVSEGEIPNPENNQTPLRTSLYRSTKTDADGRYTIFAGPGRFDIRGPRRAEIENFEITTETEREFNFHAPRPVSGPLTGLVVTGDPPQPVGNAKITGMYRPRLGDFDLSAESGVDGRFDATRQLRRTTLYARTDDGSLAGVVEIGPDEGSVTIAMQSTATANGRLIDRVTKEPFADREVVFAARVPVGDDNDTRWRTAFGGKTRTDVNGHFALPGLVIGQTYYVSAALDQDGSRRRLGSIQPLKSEKIELGELALKLSTQPPTLAERIAKNFESTITVRERYENGLRDAKLGRLRLLLLFGDPTSTPTAQFYQARYEDDALRGVLDDYWLVALDAVGESAGEVRAIAKELGVKLDEKQFPTFAVLTADGERIDQRNLADWLKDDQFDTAKVVEFLKQHALEPLDAEHLLADALERAKEQNKKVIVQETATWCGPCWRLSRFIHAHRELFEKDYIHIKLDRRWQNWEPIAERLRDGRDGGIPWYVILDGEGKTLITSNVDNGANMGFPTEPKEIEHFKNMLKQTRVRLTDDEIEGIGTDLSQVSRP